MRVVFQSRSEDETRAVGAVLAASLMPDGALLLSGDLGSGKTVLTQGLAAGLGIDREEVQSPTFTLIREHESARGSLIHIDLYRLEGEELETLGLWEILAGPGVKAVEWSERLTFLVPGAYRVDLSIDEASRERRIEIVTSDENPGLERALRSLSARLTYIGKEE